MKKWILIAVCTLMAGCTSASPQSEHDEAMSIIDWIDFVQWNDTNYTANYEANELKEQWVTGKELGETTYMLDGHAGMNHKAKNGDAAYLPIGTKLYEMEGYDPVFRIVADEKIYEVQEPGHAAVLGDFLDIRGKVKRVILQSEEDLSPVGEFSSEHTEEFVEELLSLPYEPRHELREGSRVFFGIELQDGTMTRSLYWPDTGELNYGSQVSERMAEIFQEEMKAAGDGSIE